MSSGKATGNINDLFVDYLFKFRAEHIDSWITQSQYLKTASEKIYSDLVEANKVIEEDINHGKESARKDGLLAGGLNQMWMLAVGYSIECLIKAIIILTSSEPIVNEDNTFNLDIFGSKRRPHDLYYLFNRKVDNKFKPELSPDEQAFLCKMTAYICWRGKYPVPLSAKDLLSTYFGPDNELIIRDIDYVKLKNHKDKNLFDSLYASLFEKYTQACG